MIPRIKGWAFMLSALVLSSTAYAQPCPMPQDCDPCCDNKNMRLEVDFLWWQLRQPTSYATQTTTTTSGVTTVDTTQVLAHHVDYHPGFRLGFFFEDPSCSPCWELGLIWTHLNIHHSNNRSSADGQVINLGEGILTARSSFKSHLDYLDIDFSKDFCVNSCFIFTPHVGLRGLWLNRHIDVNGAGSSGSTETSVALHAHDHVNDFGIGIEGGFWAEWKIGCGLSFVGHVGGSVLRYKNKFSEEVQVIESIGDEITSDDTDIFKGTRYVGSPTFDYYIGVNYETCLCGYEIVFRAGWEQFLLHYETHHYHGLTTGLEFKF